MRTHNDGSFVRRRALIVIPAAHILEPSISNGREYWSILQLQNAVNRLCKSTGLEQHVLHLEADSETIDHLRLYFPKMPSWLPDDSPVKRLLVG